MTCTVTFPIAVTFYSSIAEFQNVQDGLTLLYIEIDLDILGEENK